MAGACTLGAAEKDAGEAISIADARTRIAHLNKDAVVVEGQVTFICEKLGLAFVQDETGGICFDPRGARPSLAAGSFVRVTGVVTRRRDMVMLHVTAKTPQVLVERPVDFEISPLHFDLEDAGKVHVDGVLTRVTGVIRSVALHPTRKNLTFVEISFPNGSATVILPWVTPQETSGQWMNAMVVCTGVLACPAPFSLARKETDALILVPDGKSWTVRGDVLDSIFAQPPVVDVGNAAAAQRLCLDGLAAQRLHLSGVVTASMPRQWACVRLPGRSVQIMTDQVQLFEPGTRVSVACCPQMRRGKLVLLDGVFRRAAPELESVPPVRLSGDVAEAKRLSMELVQLRGILQSDPDWRGLPYVTLASAGGTRFHVQWDTFLSHEQSRGLKSGTDVMLTGILKPLHPKEPADSALAFTLVPRSAEDVRVLRGASWWTRQRLATASGWLAIIAAFGVGATIVSRRQIRRQREAVRNAEACTIAMEERSRIARELHDSLQQHLAGAALHAEALQGALATVPQMLPQLLAETAAMIRHCQIEARHCIWDLRSAAPESEDLPGAIAAWLRMKSSQLNGISLEFLKEGEMPALARDKAFQVFRIVQEAVNNAVAHAAAKQITVQMTGDKDGIQVAVTDDGCGFDVNATLLGRQGHFGLHSQRERSARIKGGLEFDSQLQRGTRVTLRVDADPVSP